MTSKSRPPITQCFVLCPMMLFILLLGPCDRKPSASAPKSVQSVLPGTDAVLSVKQFQASGDGKTDDSRAFQRALDELATKGGGTLLIPSGSYVVGNLNIGSGISIRGTGTPGAVLLKSAATDSILKIQSPPGHPADLRHDISIADVTLRGLSVESGFSEHIHNLTVSGVSRLFVYHVRFEAFQGDGAYLGSRLSQDEPAVHNLDVRIADNIFDGVNFENRNGISVIDCSGCVVEHNVFSRLSRSNMPGAIDLEPDERDEVIRNITIRNNSVLSSRGGVGSIAVVLHFNDFRDGIGLIAIEGNQIQNVKNGIAVLGLDPSTTIPRPQLNATVRSNVVKEAERPFILDGVAGITFINNDFSASQQEIQIGYAFGASDLHFTNNFFKQIARKSTRGIDLFGPVSGIEFRTNQFQDVGQHDASAFNFARGDVATITFQSNTFSSPNRVTSNAVGAAASVSFHPETNIWNGNILKDGIQMGVFPHSAAKRSAPKG